MNRKNKFKWILISFLTLITIAFSFSKLEAASIDEIKEKGQIVMGTATNYPPFEFSIDENGKEKMVGADISIGEQFAKDLGVKLVVKKMEFNSLLVGMETGKVDFVIAGMNPTEERKKSADFSKLYYTAKQYIIVNKKDKSKYKDKDSFIGKKIGVQIGTGQEQLAKKQMPDVKLAQLTKISDLIIALKTGKIQGILVESAVAEANSLHDPSLAYVDSKLKTDLTMAGMAMAFPKNSPDLVNAANQTIDKIHERKLMKSYFKKAAGYDTTTKKENGFLLVAKYWKSFAKGLGYTLFITVVSIFFGLILGLIFVLMRLSNMNILSMISKAIVEFIRGTPLMIQLMFVYFGLGQLLDVPPLIAGIIAVAINSGAYVSEIIRGGINSVDSGQTEAAKSLGLSNKDTYKSVIFPQAIKNIWPALGNEFISLFKETSIVSIIGVTDLVFKLREVQSATYKGVIPIFYAMIIYFVITFSLTKLLNYYERKMNH